MGFMMLSAVGERVSVADIDGASLPAVSWLAELADLCNHYVERGGDMSHWIEQAANAENSAVRVSSAMLVAEIEDPRTRGAIRSLYHRRQGNIPLASERNSRSPWSETLSKRLAGSRLLEHAAHPWLPLRG